jgi:hypothetical protein
MEKIIIQVTTRNLQFVVDVYVTYALFTAIPQSTSPQPSANKRYLTVLRHAVASGLVIASASIFEAPGTQTGVVESGRLVNNRNIFAELWTPVVAECVARFDLCEIYRNNVNMNGICSQIERFHSYSNNFFLNLKKVKRVIKK